MEQKTHRRSPFVFLVLTQALSVPFLVAGPILERRFGIRLPANLPATALMTVCPGLAALVLVVRREGKQAVWALLKRVLDVSRISRPRWLLPIFVLMPLIMVLGDTLKRALGVSTGEWDVNWMTVPRTFALFLLGAAGEELGWQGYAIEPLQRRVGALNGALIIGAAWGLWHVVPFLMMGRTPAWIVGQCAFSVCARVLMVWIGNNTNQSVFGAMIFHALINTTYSVSPQHGAHYDPALTALVAGAFVVLVLVFWEGKNLTRLRHFAQA